MNPNKIDIAKFTMAKRKLISYVGTRYEDVSDKFHEYSTTPVIDKGSDRHNFIKERHKMTIEITMRRENEYK